MNIYFQPYLIMSVKFQKIRDVNSPVRWNKFDSGIDFYVPNDADGIEIEPGHSVIIPLWIKIQLPDPSSVKGSYTYDMVFHNRSSIASKRGLIVWAHVIDNWYRWELMVNLINTSNFIVEIEPWEKIVQWIIRRVEIPEFIEVEEIDESTDRWAGWFWSTGNT